MSHLTHRNRPTTARTVAQLQQLPQVQRQTRFLWETPEVTTAANAMCQLADEPSDPPQSSDHGPNCRTAPAAPTGPAPDAVLVGDAVGHDGTGRDSDECDVSVSR